MAVRQKGVPVRAGADTQEKSAVRESLIRWKTVRFSIEGRVIAHSVFMLDYSSDAKLGNSFQSRKAALGKFLCQSFVHSYPFGSSLILMDERRRIYLQDVIFMKYSTARQSGQLELRVIDSHLEDETMRQYLLEFQMLKGVDGFVEHSCGTRHDSVASLVTQTT